MTTSDTVAFLGPPGTYSHQVAIEYFGDNRVFISKPTIEGTFQALGKQAKYAILPYENSIHGSVIETLDLLQSDRFSADAIVCGIATLPVNHSLLALAGGVALEDVRNVYSHEQALGQCSQFLKRACPNATPRPVSSTAKAAELVSSFTGEDGLASAAICSSICLKLYDRLELLQANIQDNSDNHTKFLILSDDLKTKPVPLIELDATLTSLVRVSMVKARSNDSSILDVFNSLGLPVSKLDRRPAKGLDPFRDCYFIEARSSKCEANEEARRWVEKVEAGVQRVAALGVNCNVLGHYYEKC